MATILCVEDDDNTQYMMHRRLGLAGYDVKVSPNGKQAVEWAKSLLPDLILMDLNLPGMDGWEATRHLKSEPETKHIPIIVLTGRMGESSHQKALAAGCDDYATKPVDFQKLLEKIEALLSPAVGR